MNVFLKPVGSAPQVAQSKRQVDAELTVSELLQQLKAELGVTSLLIYVNAAFAPCASDTLGELGKNFATLPQQCLNLHYSTTPAWG